MSVISYNRNTFLCSGILLGTIFGRVYGASSGHCARTRKCILKLRIVLLEIFPFCIKCTLKCI